jgi:hypothetical protein
MSFHNARRGMKGEEIEQNLIFSLVSSYHSPFTTCVLSCHNLEREFTQETTNSHYPGKLLPGTTASKRLHASHNSFLSSTPSQRKTRTTHQEEQRSHNYHHHHHDLRHSKFYPPVPSRTDLDPEPQN